MGKICTPHDRFFRKSMTDKRVAREFMETYLPPAIQEMTDIDSMTLCQNTYVEDTLKLTSSDVLFKAIIAGNPGYIYLLCEHQTTCDSLMPFRIWQYLIAIWGDHLKQNPGKTLPLVVPMVFYTGHTAYTGSTDICDLIQAPRYLIEQTLFQQTFQLIDLNKIDDKTLRQQLWAGMMGFVMKHVRRREMVELLNLIVKELTELEQQGGVDHAALLLQYLITVGEKDNIEQFVATVHQQLSPKLGKQTMTFAEQLVEHGKEQGEHTVLLRLLKRKFATLPQHYLNLIKEADENTLLEWAERIIDAKTLDDIFAVSTVK